MDELFKKIQKMDRKSLGAFLGDKTLFDVLSSYEAVFGAKDEYDEHLLDTILDDYFSSTEETKKAFCKFLESKETK